MASLIAGALSTGELVAKPPGGAIAGVIEATIDRSLGGLFAVSIYPLAEALIEREIHLPRSTVSGMSTGLARVQTTAAIGDQAPPSLPAGGRRARELLWRKENAELLQRYAGEWVALENDRIIAHGLSAAAVAAAARRSGIRSPYIFWVEPRRRSTSRFGL